MDHTNRVITLLSDFGARMGYVAQMKGVVLSINPAVHLIDITHDIPAHNIAMGAYVLEKCIPHFPTGTIHLAVVDPGVGASRPAVLIETDTAFFVGPDNGLFGFLQESPHILAVHRLVNERYFLDSPSETFHGRDVFSPVAGYLSLGYQPDEFGPVIDGLIVLPNRQSKPTIREEGCILGEVIAIDNFGNLVSSITTDDIEKFRAEQVGNEIYAEYADKIIPIRKTFSDVPTKELVAYIGSSGQLEIAVNMGNAALEFSAREGMVIKLITM